MHIALCSPAWPLAKNHNGIVTYVHWTKIELERLGHRVSVFTGGLHGEDEGVYRVVEPGLNAALRKITRRFAPSYQHVFDWSNSIAASMLQVHRRDPIDIIEMEETFGWFADVARRTSIPVIVKLHGPSFLSLVEEELDTPFGQACIEREGKALLQADVIASPCEVTLRQTVDRYGLSPAIAEHIVNPVAENPASPRWTLSHSARETVLFVGRFDKRKGGDLVIDAFARLLLKRPTLKLVFVGPDRGLTQKGENALHFADYVKRALPHALHGQVDYKGALSQSEVSRLRTEAAVTVIASRWENQGYTALEAMLQACPIVSSDAGGGPEIILHGKTGLLFRTGDATDLANKVEMLLEDPTLAEALGRSAHRFVTEVHGPARVAAQSLRLYKRVIAAKGVRP